MNRLTQARTKEYYKLLDSSPLPNIANNSTRYSKQASPQKTVQRIVKSSHFVYIDLDEQSGFRVMDKQTPNTDDEEIEKIGNSMIWNLKNLSDRGQQTIQYLSKLKEAQKQKQSMRRVFKHEIERSIQKINKRKSYKLDYSLMNQRRQLEFDPSKLKQLVETQQLDSLNQSIWLKQKRLIQKLGIGNNYVSASPENDSKRKQSNKKLPHLTYRTIQR